MPPVRRLTAILAADVAGYSRLMGIDEEGTHERLKTHLRELVDPKIAEHRGRVVKNTGDGFLAEFASVVDAVRCSVEVQRGMAGSEPDVPEDRRIKFRVGVNLGDVIAEEHDIFGDGVNVAARLEALAEPGGICVSRVVRDQVRDKLDYAFEDQGDQEVKNIARPVRVYVWRPEDASAVPTTSASSAASSSSAVAARRLSIVVLPFANLSNDPEQQYFADGITDDLTTDLSRIANMLVISRSTAFTYQKKSVGAKQIGRELGVRYLLQGSVRRSGNHVRVSTQLIDGGADAHLWAERFDRNAGNLFALQDEITRKIAVALDATLVSMEAARGTGDPDAFDSILRGRAAYFRPRTRDNYEEMLDLFERALTLDTRSVEAHSYLARTLAGGALDGLTNSPAADIARAEDHVKRALAASPHNPLALYARGQVLRAQNRIEEAIREYEAVLAIDRNCVDALINIGWGKLWTGALDEMISCQEQVIRLSPRDPRIGNSYYRIGLVHVLQSRTEEAIHWLEQARNASPGLPYIRAWLTSAYALTGDIQLAAAELAEARKLSVDGRYSSIARLKGVGYFGVPKIRALFEATYLTGLRKAGMPEE
jgi:adenylate cyclase